jgi:hypothetical protein
MRWVTSVAAPILLANVGDQRFRAFSLDPKRGDERIFGVHGDAVRLSFQFKPDGELHRTPPLPITLGQTLVGVQPMRKQWVANQVCCAGIAASVFKEVVGQT